VSDGALEALANLLPEPGPDGLDMLALIEDDAYWERIGGAVDPAAEAKFINPGGGFIGVDQYLEQDEARAAVGLPSGG
jgi:hypothetical protein